MNNLTEAEREILQYLDEGRHTETGIPPEVSSLRQLLTTIAELRGHEIKWRDDLIASLELTENQLREKCEEYDKEIAARVKWYNELVARNEELERSCQSGVAALASNNQEFAQLLVESKRLHARNEKLKVALEFECGNRCAEQNPCNAKLVLREALAGEGAE